MYKECSRLGLRFQTSKGLLTVEQLWQLSLIDLSNAIKDVKAILKKTEDDDLSFLEESKVKDVENQLRFNILKDVYVTRKTEAEAIRNEAQVKAHRQKILNLIAEKRENKLRDMTEEELEKLLDS